MSKENKSSLFSLIDNALQLDSLGSSKEAYCNYLDGIKLLCIHLIDQEKVSEGIPSTVEAKKRAKQIFSVVRKCLERLDALVDENDGDLRKAQNKEEITTTRPAMAFAPLSYFPARPPKPISRNLLPKQQNPRAPESNGILEIASTHRPMIIIPSVKSQQRMSAMEHAQRENALLYYAYERRIAQPTDRSNRISFQLELQRRMAENLAIAKAKDAVYREEEMKKEKKALEKAARKLFRKDKTVQSECDSNGNKKEWEKQWLYARMLQYDDQESWPNNLRKRLKDEPELTAEAIRNTLSTPDYPLVEWMLHAITNIQFKIQTILDKHSDCMRLVNPQPVVQFKAVVESKRDETCTNGSGAIDGNVLSMFDPLLPVVENDTDRKLSNVEILHHELFENSLRRQLNKIVTDISNLTDTVGHLISLNYEISNDHHDLCYQTVEEHVFSFLWWKLQVIFRMCNEETEKKISQTIKHFHNLTPEQMDVPYYFSQLPTDTYNSILVHLQSITKLYTPILKLQTLVQVVEEINKQPEAQAQLNADDLISIISYLIVQSDIPQLVSECDALDCLVPQMYLMGEEGFVLTTFQTALKYLETQMDAVYSEKKRLAQ